MYFCFLKFLWVDLDLRPLRIHRRDKLHPREEVYTLQSDQGKTCFCLLAMHRVLKTTLQLPIRESLGMETKSVHISLKRELMSKIQYFFKKQES